MLAESICHNGSLTALLADRIRSYRQGDERDVILISVNIGYDREGKLPLTRLSLLNWEGGYRRLNVLITRAKYRTVVYSSFQPEDLGVNDDLSDGAQMLKEFLAYARDVRKCSQTNDEETLPATTDFQFSICEALRQKGYGVVPRVGVESYRIDVAIAHPDEKDKYILGIENDGSLYHAGHSARDRDRLRQKVLTDLGWNLHRIWSADWFRNRELEIEKVVRRIESLRRMKNLSANA